MKTRKTFKFVLMALATITVLFGIVSCTRFVSDQKEQAVEQPDEINWQIYSEPTLPEETDTELPWMRYSDEKLSFDYPVNWSVKVEQNHLEIKSTAKEIVIGGAAPEDYYLDGTTTVNTEKYATDYYLLTIDISDGSIDWDQFFADNYDGVILSYQPYLLPTRPDLKSVAPTKVSGVLYGEQRFFARNDQTILDVSLSYKGWNEKQAQKILNTFLKSFSF